jgi:phosphoribosylpyrophosphate synthetase
MEYIIAGKKYIQRPLVIGQLKQLSKLLKDVVISPDAGAAELVEAIGDKLSEAIAIVLIPEGVDIKDKNIEEIVKELEFQVDIETAVKIIEDFFDCNQVSSLLKRLQNAIKKTEA